MQTSFKHQTLITDFLTISGTKAVQLELILCGNFMKEISKQAGLSFTYTNHCIRGTTASAMKRFGYALPDIAKVTGHQNLESLKYYLENPTLQDKQNYSNDLFKYTGQECDSDKPDMSDFETPPPPKCTKVIKHKKKSTPTATITGKEICKMSDKSESSSELGEIMPSKTQNILQT